MASIQPKTSRGQKYWYIVESRRVNGKPRPIVLEYLGKAETLLKRLRGLSENYTIKSYSHGSVVALLDIAQKLNVPSIINQHIKSQRSYMAEKPVRHKLTAGITFLLGAIGRACKPTSKDGWWDWARTTSSEYLLRVALSKVDSSHFWDMMDSLPVEAIEKIEFELLQRAREVYNLESDTLLFDTTNFFTYIDSTNSRCTIARRGKNKQKRYDLRQVGLAMVVTRQDNIPLFHITYEGNMNDSKVFKEVVGKVKERMVSLGLDLKGHTLVFDQGNNSKSNMALIKELDLYYVGALTPYQHKALVSKAADNFEEITVRDKTIQAYREKRKIWGEERTVLVIISDKLRAGQLRGIYQALEKKEKKLQELVDALDSPNARKRDKDALEERIRKLVKGQYLAGMIDWSLAERPDGKLKLNFEINKERLESIEEELGYRILMTNRHEWTSAEIIDAYHGQSAVESAFKKMKNPFHLALRPQFHWTDQKIIVHNFICVLGYQLASILLREARLKAKFTGSMNTLLTTLDNVRLSVVLEQLNNKGKPKITYKLEEMSEEENALMEALDLKNLHIKRPEFKGVGVYN
ncbi:MAG: IS1634 family transposase [Candidatus Aegiribacteria sp.]|nr:IS1634 family transposase [Candidatus Aegiribacteria sp.]